MLRTQGFGGAGGGQLKVSHFFIFVGFVAGLHIEGSLFGLLFGGITGFICHQLHVYFFEPALDRAGKMTEFYYLTIMLQAKCAKADGAVTPEEIKAFKEFMHVPARYHVAVGGVFDNARKSTVGYESIAQRLKDMCTGEKAVDLLSIYESLHYIAAANHEITEQQMAFLKAVGSIFGYVPAAQKKLRLGWGISENGVVKEPRFSRSGRASFVAEEINGKSVYNILGITEKATLEQVRKAYRTQLKKKHPDKLRGDGASELEIKRAEAEVSDLTEAYEMLKLLLKEDSQRK